jgi:hypothetical protein
MSVTLREILPASPWRAGARAARANLVPGLILQAAAFALLVAYWLSPELRRILKVVEEWKASGGFAFAAATGAFFCGLLPWLLRMALPKLRPKRPLAELLFGTIWWALLLMSTDIFYRGQAQVWGEGNSTWVVVAKVLTDALIYTPFWAAPLNSLSHHWKAQGFPLKGAEDMLKPGWYQRIVLPNLLPNWVVWVPGVTVVYALPTMLQLPVASLIGCFWALLCISIAAPEEEMDPLV